MDEYKSTSNAKSLRVGLVGLFGLILFLLTVVFSSSRGDASPLPSTASTFAISALPASPTVLEPAAPFGVYVLSGAGAPNFGALLDRAQALGARYVRVYLNWGIIASNPPTANCASCYWGAADLLFSQIAARNLKPIVTMGDSPAWASTYPDGPIDKPGGLSGFATVLTGLGTRYPNVHHYLFFTEPDDWLENSGNTPRRGWGGHGAEYAGMLKVAYPALHNANPNAVVIFGSIAYENWGCPSFPNGQCFDMNLVGSVLANGGGPYFDVMSYNFFTAFGPNYTPPNIIGKALRLRQNFPGLGNKPFIVAETGTPYLSNCSGSFSHEDAARAVVRTNMHAIAAQDPAYNVKFLVMTWFSMEYFHDYNCGGQDWGLLDANGNPFPLEQATYRTMTSELNLARYESMITGIPYVEGYYLFGPTARQAVVWSTSVGPQPVSFQTTFLRWRDKAGNATQVVDGGPGDLDNSQNGQIRLNAPPSPIFVEFTSTIVVPAVCNGC